MGIDRLMGLGIWQVGKEGLALDRFSFDEIDRLLCNFLIDQSTFAAVIYRTLRWLLPTRTGHHIIKFGVRVAVRHETVTVRPESSI